jgi:hypothetical protein
MSASPRYVGGPFHGGVNPDDFIDQIEMRSPAGLGRYVLDRDEHDRPIYRWEPEVAVGES